jgi:hypothetical protein
VSGYVTAMTDTIKPYRERLMQLYREERKRLVEKLEEYPVDDDFPDCFDILLEAAAKELQRKQEDLQAARTDNWVY